VNYRHAFHAGNFADVHKHSSLLLLLAHLRRKETAFHVIDSHAGIGRYDLEGIEAGKTGEWEEGVGLLRSSKDPLLADYLAQVAGENAEGTLRFYPGSPLLIRNALRPADRMTLIELHPEDAASVKQLFRKDRQVTIREEDGYQALKALLPFKERRGLVLIDPPFEVTDEFQRVIAGLSEALKRFATGIYAIWYPIKSAAEVAGFKAELTQFGKPCLAAELMRFDFSDNNRLNGSGLAVLNPPWQLDEQMVSLLRSLHDALGCRGETRLDWLVRG